ncbi:MAG: NB-ARC domain-containing protein, partial [Chloroflexota bacterium]
GNPVTSNPLDILDVWAQAYGNDFSHLPDIESKAAAVRGILANKKVLVVLDNVDDAGQVRTLLPSGESCRVILTTRNLEVAAALNAQHVRMQEFSTQSSEKLMVRILGENRLYGPPDQLRDAQKIIQQLHRLPLAIEIAAQRLRSRPSMPLAAMATRLEHTQQRLGLKISDQAVRGSFEVSWGGLLPLSQEVFTAMGIFEGRSFLAEALSAITNVGLFDLEDELYSLAVLSLVNAAGEGRYQQHPLLADFAAEKEPNFDSRRDGFVRYYLAFAQDNREQFERLEPEWANLSAAIERAAEAKTWDVVFDFADALGTSWLRYGRYADADQAYALAEKGAKEIGSDSQRAHALLRWAEIDIERSYYQAAKNKLKTAKSLFEQFENIDGVAQSDYFHGLIAFEQNEYLDAEAFLLNSQKAQVELGNVVEEARATNLLAYIYFETDDSTQKAETYANKALALLDSETKSETNVSILKILAWINIRNSKIEQAELLAQQALDLSRLLNKPAEIGDALRILVTINRKMGNLNLAEEQAEASLAQFQKIGNRRFEAMILYRLAQIYFDTDRVNNSLEALQASTNIYTEVEEYVGYGYALSFLGKIEFQAGNLNRASTLWFEAQKIADDLSHPALKNHIEKYLILLA